MPWDGFADGSWVQMKNSTTMEMPGAPATPQVQETRQTLVKTTDEAWTIRTETKVGDAWENPFDFPFPRKAKPGESEDVKPKEEDLGADKATVEGKEYAVKKVRTTYTMGDVTTVTVSWVSAEHGALRAESEVAGVKSTMEVTSLAKKVKVGDKELTVREMKTVSKAPQGDSTMIVQWSDGVPGRMVRTETTAAMGGAGKMHTVAELVAFEAK
jgi:hypothetical protein